MKTTKNFLVLSLVLIFAAVTSAYSAGIDSKNNQISASPVIRYHVNIVMSIEKPLCNLWLVEIRDGMGRLVAPAQAYNGNKNQYDFYERGPASGARIAVLVKYQYGDHYVCETELFTKPAILFGPFLNGQTYRFDLFPATTAAKEE